jgi:tRNA threonylcarbamoyl adenosine modification protein YeaZ
MRSDQRILAIECATEACSVALFGGDGYEDGPSLLDHRHETIGRGHAERLVPLIAELPERGRADRILVSLGPGSFTGTRIGLAAARSLAIAWGADVRGYPTLALVAAMARSGTESQAEAEHERRDILVAMAGGHGEIFVQPFGPDGHPSEPHRSLPTESAAGLFRTEFVAGNIAAELVDRRGSGLALDLLPDARFACALPQALLTDRLAPIYGRAPDAKPRHLVSGS